MLRFLRVGQKGALWQDIMDLCWTDAMVGGMSVTYSDVLDMDWEEFRFYLSRVRRIREKAMSRIGRR